MKKFKLLLLALMCVAFLPSKADEGMWLLQLMQEQHFGRPHESTRLTAGSRRHL